MPHATTHRNLRIRSVAALAAFSGLAAAASAQPMVKPPVTHLATDCPTPVDKCPTTKPAQPVVQLAICLDTSGSMSGLIHQAQMKLWAIVNELGRTRCHGVAPRVEVAIYHYGNNGLPAEEGFLTCLTPFTSDLDYVSQQLFSLGTNGGSEYCGWVTRSAARELNWSDKAAMRMLVIAGNEPFTQGPVDYRQAAGELINKRVVMNTIHCGDYSTGVATNWADGARLTGGTYSAIDHNADPVCYDTPYDTRISALNSELNTTYYAYGRADEREARTALQYSMDSAAEAMAPAALADRAQAKAGVSYENSSWDLVDAIEQDTVKLEDLDDELLPEPLQNLSVEEQKAVIATAATRRAEIQAEINELGRQRNAFLEQKRQEAAEGGVQTLDQALIQAIHEQAKANGLEIEAPEAPAPETPEPETVKSE